VYRMYHAKYQGPQGGKISITLSCDWGEPFSNSTADVQAAQRYLEFFLGWFADPIHKDGDYPPSMKQSIGNRLPAFTPEQQRLLKGSSDFFGLNHYTSFYVQNGTAPGSYGWDRDTGTFDSRERNGTFIGPVADSPWLYIVPWGIQKMLVWISERYNRPEIWITENGMCVRNESSMPLQQALNDTDRINYYNDYLTYVLKAIEDDEVRVAGYFAWSLMDNFEWADGYTRRFGIHYVDYTTPNRTRTPKQSALWYSDLIKSQKRGINWIIVGVVLGVIAFFVISITIGLAYRYVMRRKGSYQIA